MFIKLLDVTKSQATSITPSDSKITLNYTGVDCYLPIDIDLSQVNADIDNINKYGITLKQDPNGDDLPITYAYNGATKVTFSNKNTSNLDVVNISFTKNSLVEVYRDEEAGLVKYTGNLSIAIRPAEISIDTEQDFTINLLYDGVKPPVPPAPVIYETKTAIVRFSEDKACMVKYDTKNDEFTLEVL